MQLIQTLFRFFGIKQKKTIVFLTHEYPPIVQGGICVLVHSLATKMAELGHQVHVIVIVSHEKPSITLEENVWVHRINIKLYDYDFLRKVTNENFIMNKNMSLNSLIRAYSVYDELLSIYEQHSVDIVHSFLWGNLNFYVIDDKKFKSVMTLVTPAIYFPNTGQIELQLEKFIIENTKYINTDSNFIYDFCKQYYPNIHSKYYLCYLGLADRSKDNIPALYKDPDIIEILFIGRLEVRKGIDTLFSCIPDICKDFPNVKFIFVGNNTINMPKQNKTYKDMFIEKHNNLVESKQVVFEGIVPDTAPYYASCDIFVAPSLFESFGMIYAEAMVFSKPVIGCNVAAIPEVVENNVVGLLAKPNDVESLKQCLITLITNKELRDKFGKAGRKRYEELFHVDKMVNNYLKYYDTIINEL